MGNFDDKIAEMKQQALDSRVNKHSEVETSGDYLFNDIANFFKGLGRIYKARKKIKTKKENDLKLERCYEILEAPKKTLKGIEAELLVKRISEFEKEHYPMGDESWMPKK